MKTFSKKVDRTSKRNVRTEKKGKEKKIFSPKVKETNNKKYTYEYFLWNLFMITVIGQFCVLYFDWSNSDVNKKHKKSIETKY